MVDDQRNQSGEQLSLSDIAANEGLKAAFWRPLHLPMSAWLEHIPFAFWLMSQHRPRVVVELGAHYGASYFAFCQAAEALALDTRCYAVDTWQGDEHAGSYGEDVYALVSQRNQQLYSQFSSLIRATFDDTVSYFPDSSIDLLHIDGFHTEAEVRKDVETWMPKLSDRAVLLLHDTNVRERNFGVAKVLAELRERYPVFDFAHGHGLGVVGVGKNLSPGLDDLFAADANASSRRDIMTFFARLGRACADARGAANPAPASRESSRGQEFSVPILVDRFRSMIVGWSPTKKGG